MAFNLVSLRGVIPSRRRGAAVLLLLLPPQLLSLLVGDEVWAAG